MSDPRWKKNYYPDWQCPRCDMKNFGSRSECLKCGLFRNKADIIVNYWPCQCGCRPNTLSACWQCGDKRPDNVIETNMNNYKNSIKTKDNIKTKPGDWTCSCGELNFKNRTLCRKCSKNK